MPNLFRVQLPEEERAYRIDGCPSKPPSIIMKALRKHLPADSVNAISEDYRRSNITPEGLQADYHKGNIDFHEVEKDSIYRQALSLVRTLFCPHAQYRPVHFTDLRYYPWTLSTSAEAPFKDDPQLTAAVKLAHSNGELSDSRMSKHNLYNHAFVVNRTKVHHIKEGLAHGNQLLSYNTAHARSHLVSHDEPDKVRMVFGVPWLLLMVELMLLWPLMNFLRLGTSPLLWGYETLTGGVYKLFREAGTHVYRPLTWLCLDWSQFDKRARFTIIDDIHDMWQSLMDTGSGYIPTADYPTTSTVPWRINNLWNWMRRAVRFTPDLLPDGSMWKRSHSGIASGLMQTQVLDSFVNAIMILSCLIELGFKVDADLFIKILGDDSIVGLAELVAPQAYQQLLDDIARTALRRFGAILNVKKSSISESLTGCTLLGYTLDNGIPTRPELDLLAQLAWPERRWTPSRLMARAQGIAYASAGQSKVVYDVCKDVWTFLETQGNKPDPLGYPWLSVLSDNAGFEYDLTLFPAFDQLSSRLLNPDYDRTRANERFWNSSHFLDTK